MKFLGALFIISFCMVITGNAGVLGEFVAALGQALSNMTQAFSDGINS